MDSPCTHINPPEARFCSECGLPLERRCWGCNAPLAPRAKFCNQCGTAVGADPDAAGAAVSGEFSPPLPGAEPSRHTLDGERRQLTLLFCDLVGSTEMAARFDPEDWHTIAARYQRVATEAVTRFGGHVAKYVGDGLVVYFGYPQAHEDDPERAVRGGLAILDAIASVNQEIATDHDCRLAVRIGLHTGAVVVGQGGGREFEVFGDAPNLAARLQTVAVPDTVVISEATRRLVRGIFVVEDRGVHSLKGIAQPVRVYRVLQPSGVRSRLADDDRTRLVGRDTELQVLVDGWQRARRGAGGAVLICGEPGVGKSRLVRALRERVADEAHTWLECHCTAFTQDSAFNPIIELVEHALAFQREDRSADKQAKLERGLTAAGLFDTETFALFLDFLSIPLEGATKQLPRDVQRERLLESLVQWTLALGQRQPLIIFVEDLHWCDPSSLELLGRVIEGSAGAAVFVVSTARPECTPPWSATPGVLSISLQRLSEAAARQIVLALQGELPDDVMQMIVARADGLPLYLEELTKALLESETGTQGRRESVVPLDALAIPATLQDSLMARLDRLSAAKQVAQIAAVLGREFPYRLLQSVAALDDAILRDGLDRLVDAELLVARAVAPEPVYAFKHALIQDAAYQSVLKRTRQQLHGRIARALEERFADRAVREPEVVARHYEAAGLHEEAIEQYQRAAGQAVVRSAHEESVRHLRRALELLQGCPPSRAHAERELTLQLALGNALLGGRSLASPEAQMAYERARELCESVGDHWQLAPALWGLSVFYTTAGELDRGIELAEQLVAVSERTGADIHWLSAHEELAVPLYYRGAFAESLRHCEQAIEIYNLNYDPARNESMAWIYPTDPGVPIRIYAGLNRWQLGYPEQAGVWLDEAERLARDSGHPYSIAFALVFHALLHWMMGNTDGQAAAANEVISIAERHRLLLWLAAGKMIAAGPLAQAGQCETAVESLQAGLELAARVGGQAGAPAFFALQAEVLAAAGQYDAALNVVAMGLAMAEHSGQHFWTAELMRRRGELLLASSATPTSLRQSAELVEVEQCFRAALSTAAAQDARGQQLRAATSLARLLQAQGNIGAAAEVLSPIYDTFTEGFETRDLAEARALLAKASGSNQSPKMTEEPLCQNLKTAR